MYTFGSTGIVAGYIKQLLASFHLPKLPIYTREHEAYLNKHLVESPYILESFPPYKQLFPTNTWMEFEDANGVKHSNPDGFIKVKEDTNKLETINGVAQVDSTTLNPYIKDGRIQFYLGGYYDLNHEYVPGKWQSLPLDINNTAGGSWELFNRDSEMLNITKQFQIKNNIYDTYTHEYLGEYLRFLRDYDGIDLMSMYNCFSNNISLDIKYTGNQAIQLNNGRLLELDTSDKNYKIYAIPVKLFKNYTIAIDSNYPVEMFCGLYSTKLFADEDKKLIKNTYQRYGNMQFASPVLYTALTDLAASHSPALFETSEYVTHKNKRDLLAKIAPHSSELKLFIKVSSLVDSSIVVLEGDYRGWNDFTFESVKQSSLESSKFIYKANKTVLDNKAIFADAPVKLIAPLQLLRLNTGKQMPFADRLLEYLLDNCITGGPQETRENVLMAQTLASQRHKGLVCQLSYTPPAINAQQVNKPITITPDPLKYNLVNGVWTESLRRIFYNNQQNRGTAAEFVDCLGYVDKDVEKNFVAYTSNAKGKVTKKTMLNFNTWEDISE